MPEIASPNSNTNRDSTFNGFGIALDIEDRLLELSAHGIDGLEGIVLEEFLADFIPEVFLWIELWRVGWQEEQRDVGGNREISATMVGSAIENQQDVLPGKPSRQDVEECLEARRIRRRHDQVDAHPDLRRDCTVQIDVFANEL